MSSVLTLTVGHHLADVPMILVGIDPCFSCNDRGIVVAQGNDHEHWTWERLRKIGLDYYGLAVNDSPLPVCPPELLQKGMHV
jgi:NADH-quinone oxidoreductase subunit D